MNQELQNLKNEIANISIPETILIKINLILDKGIQNGKLTEEEEQELDNILNTAIAESELEAEFYQQIADSYHGLIDETSQQLKPANPPTKSSAN